MKGVDSSIHVAVSRGGFAIFSHLRLKQAYVEKLSDGAVQRSNVSRYSGSMVRAIF